MNIVKDSKSKWCSVRDIDDIYPTIYNVEQCLQGFIARYFPTDELLPDNQVKRLYEYQCDYEFMAAQLRMISNEMFRLRVMAEFVAGGDESVVSAHARLELGLMRQHKELWSEILRDMAEEYEEQQAQIETQEREQAKERALVEWIRGLTDEEVDAATEVIEILPELTQKEIDCILSSGPFFEIESSAQVEDDVKAGIIEKLRAKRERDDERFLDREVINGSSPTEKQIFLKFLQALKSKKAVTETQTTPVILTNNATGMPVTTKADNPDS